jgi:putative transcriptional regulator
MSLRKRLLFAILLTIVALAEPGRVNVHKTEFDAPKPNTWLRAPMPAAPALPWSGSQPANKLSRSLKAFQRRGELLPALFLPIQFKNPKDLGVGKLLVASRGLGDPIFAETVILLVHCDEKGVLGLVLNRRTDVPLSRVLDLQAAKDRSDPVYLGGPVGLSGALALFQSSANLEKAENIFGRVYLITDKGLFEQTIAAHPGPGVFHVYLGYAGWTQDQLRSEVQLGAWFVFPADAATVFNSDPDSLWMQMIQNTELQLAKIDPFAEISQPLELFNKSRVIHERGISQNASFRESHPVTSTLL